MAKTILFTLQIDASQTGQSFDKVKARVKELNTLIKELEAQQLLGEPIDTTQLEKAKKELASIQAIQKANRQTTRDLQKEFEASGKAGSGAYRALSAQLVVSRRRLKDLAAEGKTGTKEFKSLSREVQTLDKRLKGIDASAGQFQRSVGNYANAVRGLGTSILSAFGIVGGVNLLANGLKASLDIINNFEQSIADLGAISQASEEDLLRLSNNAKELGAVTAFSATQVVGLQTELAKLGFNTDQIENATKAIIDFAVATDAEAGRAAALAGSALRAFGLEAQETERVVSTLAVATTKSALDFNKLEQGLSTVAPVAASFGFSIEETVALLGQLANAGFDASSSATATRNILLNLADANGILAKELGGSIDSFDDLIPALAKLRDEGIDLNETLQLTDKRSVAAFNTFLQGAESAGELRDSITGANDELEKMASDRLDSVRGQTKLLSSAWEGFVLSIEDGSGELSNFFKGALASATQFLTDLRILNEDSRVGFSDLFTAGGIETQISEQDAVLNLQLKRLKDTINSVDDLDLDFFSKVVKSFQFAGFDGIEEANDKANAFIKSLKDGLNDPETSVGAQELSRDIEGIGNAAKSTDNTINGLKEKLKELKEQQAATNIDSSDFTRIAGEISKAQKQLDDALGKTNKKLKEQKEVADPESLAGLKAVVSQLKKELELINGNDTSAIETQLEKIAEKEKDIETLNEEIETLQNRLERGDQSVDINLLPTLADNIDPLKELGGLAEGIKIKADIEFDSEEAKRQFDNFVNGLETLDTSSQIEAIENRLRAETDSIDQQSQLYQQLQTLKDEQHAKDLEQIEEKKQLRNEALQTGLQLAETAANAIFDIQKRQLEQETDADIEALENRYSRRLEAAEGNVEVTAQLEEELAREREKIEKEAAEKRKQIALNEARIAAALAAIKAAPNPFAIAAALAFGIAQELIIRNTQFKKGGVIKKDGTVIADKPYGKVRIGWQKAAKGARITDSGEIQGPSHKDGGVPLKIQTRTGYIPIEAEGGERIDRDEKGNVVIINKRSSKLKKAELDRIYGKSYQGKLADLDKINRSGGGIPLKAQDGILVEGTPSANGPLQLIIDSRDIAEKVSVAFAKEIPKMASQVSDSVSNAIMETAPIQAAMIGNETRQGLRETQKEIEAERELADRSTI